MSLKCQPLWIQIRQPVWIQIRVQIKLFATTLVSNESRTVDLNKLNGIIAENVQNIKPAQSIVAAVVVVIVVCGTVVVSVVVGSVVVVVGSGTRIFYNVVC